MKPFFLISTFIASVCLAADCNGRKSDNASLDNVLLPKDPKLIPPVLVAYHGWDKDMAMAFAVGLALGKQCDKQVFLKKKDNGLGEEKECDILKFEFDGRYNMDVEVIVNMENLNQVISANVEWDDGDKAYNPLSELFDIQSIQESKIYLRNTLENVRRLFVKYARNATALIAIDVAILKWLVHAINAKPENYHIVGVEGSIVLPICALSLNPQLGGYFTNDILTMLTQVQYYIDPECTYYGNVDFLTPSLVTLIKMLDDGPIRTKVAKLVIKMYHVLKRIYLDCRMLLGDEHPIVKQMEEGIAGEVISKDNHMLQQSRRNHTVHTMNFGSISSLANNVFFIHLSEHFYLSAAIEEKSTLIWDETTPEFGWEIRFKTKSDSHPRLFIFSQLPVPATVWKHLTSCSSLLMFEDILKNSIARRMILTYGITIFESNFEYSNC